MSFYLPAYVSPIFTGTYKFDRYDEKLEDFLESLGLSPIEFGPVVRNAELRVSVRAPYVGSTDKRWTLTHYETGKGPFIYDVTQEWGVTGRAQWKK